MATLYAPAQVVLLRPSSITTGDLSPAKHLVPTTGEPFCTSPHLTMDTAALAQLTPRRRHQETWSAVADALAPVNPVPATTQ